MPRFDHKDIVYYSIKVKAINNGSEYDSHAL